MRSFKETLQSFRNKVIQSDSSLLPGVKESVLPTEPKVNEQSATTVFDQAIKARNPRHLDNHLNSYKTEIKIFESAPKLR